MGCDTAGGVACPEGHKLHVHSLDTHSKNRDATQDDVGPYTLRNVQAMLLKPVCNAWSCDLLGEHCNTRYRHSEFVSRWEAGVPASVLHSAPLSLFAAAHPAASDEYCGTWLELAGERRLQLCPLRACGRSSKIDCQLSYIQASLSCRQQNSRDVFHRTWWSKEPVYSPLWALI